MDFAIAIDSMTFLNPVYIGDFICCYAEVIKVGNTSMKIHIETWATTTDESKPRRKVTVSSNIEYQYQYRVVACFLLDATVENI